MGIDKEKERSEDFKSVKLKSYFGIHPFICWCLKIIIIFLAIAIIPSFWTNRRRLFISTNPGPLEVLVDGESVGRSPGNIKVKQGVHRVDVYCGERAVASSNIKIRPSLFFSYFFEYKKKINIEVKLIEEDIKYIERYLLKSLVNESLAYNLDMNYKAEDIFSIAKGLLEGRDDSFLEKFQEYSLYFISNQTEIDDYNKSFGKDYKKSLAYLDAEPSAELYIKEEVEKKENFIRELKIADEDFIETESYFIAKSPVSKNLFKSFWSILY